jgi:hypothetical protein
MKVGDKIWYFNTLRRIYAKPGSGRLYSTGGPIYREHWIEVEINGETSRSWITVYGKCPKKGYRKPWALFKTEVDADYYIEENAYKISEAVRRIQHDLDTWDAYRMLKAVASAINYTPESANQHRYG